MATKVKTNNICFVRIDLYEILGRDIILSDFTYI